ncbi:IS3 family transposase [Verrucomicrobium sp. 3C]|uniref:IS3 family transposase n=1 Tax=Verrucomicrobium sp. 3C TaxID=1134055 RepID=UPI0003A953CF|nr:IS3 family transposase [Verrucomicrobium sp. 3C]
MQKMTKDHCLTELAEALEVSRSGFHAHQHKDRGSRRQRDKQLLAAIHPVFLESRRTYGSPRITWALRKAGEPCGKNRVARLMRELGLRAKQKRRFRPRTTDSAHRLPVADNWLARMPAPDRPNQIWIGDITYIPTAEGWLYLCGILDACSRRCVGWHAEDSLSTPLVTRAWNKAWKSRRPDPGLLHHSDRGVQYASGEFNALLHSCGAVASMSRKGQCYDNAMMESFWATLKTECFGSFLPKTKQEAKIMIFDYIECFYNRRRLHSGLHYQSPLDFEKNLANLNN